MNKQKLWFFLLICSLLVFPVERSHLLAQEDAAGGADASADVDASTGAAGSGDVNANPGADADASTGAAGSGDASAGSADADASDGASGGTAGFADPAIDANPSANPGAAGFADPTTESAAAPPEESSTWSDELDDGLYARIQFDAAEIIVSLYFQKNPISVIFFTGLASGLFPYNETPDPDTTTTGATTTDTTTANTAAVTKKKNDSGNLYDNAPVLKHIPGFLLYTNIRDTSPEEYQNYSFKRENYFVEKKNLAGSGFLALTSSSNIESSSELLFIFKNVESYPLTPTVIGTFVSGNEELKKASEIQTLRSVSIMAVGQRAKTFLRRINYDDFLARAQSIEDRFYNRREREIQNTIQVLRNKKHNKTVNDIFFTFDEGSIGNNLDSIEHPTLSRAELLDFLTGKELDITQLSNRRPEKPGSIFLHYRSKNNSTDQEIYNSYTQNSPIPYAKLRKEAIEGVRRLLVIMSPGQSVTAFIPPALAYKEEGFGPLVGSGEFLEVELTMFTSQGEGRE